MNPLNCSKCNEECYFIDTTKSREIKELFGCACDLCKKVFCRNCNRYGSNEIRVMCTTRNWLKFFCHDCLELINATVKDVPSINKKIDNLEKETRELKDILNDNALSYAQVVADTSDLKKQVEGLNTEVTAQKTKSKVLTQAPLGENAAIEHQPASAMVTELIERENRKRNILIFGITENNNPNREDRIKNELELIKSSLQTADPEVRADEIKFHRVGKFTEGKARPIKVIFPTISDAQRILKNKNKLPNTNTWYIKYDQTAMERAYLSQVLAELEDRKKNGENNLKIKYINSVPKITKTRLQPKN